jgi:hypothetical protein
MAEQHRRVYTGRSGEEKGTEPTLRNAIDDAYEEAKAGRRQEGFSEDDPFWFRVVDIWVKGTNPITDYRVDVTD